MDVPGGEMVAHADYGDSYDAGCRIPNWSAYGALSGKVVGDGAA